MERRTAQRESIQQVFARFNRPLSPQEVLKEARRRTPRLGLATVYRAIRALESEGRLHAVTISGQSPRYEWCDASHHHYFHCAACDQVFKLEGCADNLDRLVPKGFKIEGHEIMLSGKCPACRNPRR
ncbi:MAG: transcriptional repressor [Verrucomicrobia bacterium]|nr:transcriptional repressor [Verrucomicrobiota bacterium]